MSIRLKILSHTQIIKTVDNPQRSIGWSKSPGQSYITITKSTRQLTLTQGNSPLREYPVAIGKPATPTPEGNFAVAVKVLSPGGVLGSRWLGLNFGSYGIHGTNAPWFIGQMVSHGCIRMHDADVEELFGYAYLGMPVYIRD
jgi:lipoprotein-anchoring transpeptidase ErfK/SrfK